MSNIRMQAWLLLSLMAPCNGVFPSGAKKKKKKKGFKNEKKNFLFVRTLIDRVDVRSLVQQHLEEFFALPHRGSKEEGCFASYS